MGERSDGIVLAGVVASYGAGAPVLRGVDFAARNGEITAVIGPNGSGKSSLLKTICGMLDRHDGSYTLNGRDASRLGPRSFGRERIRYVPQGNAVFPALTVEDNLRLAAWSLRISAAELREAFERIFATFEVLYTKRRSLAAWLSGGEQRQLEFARALMADPVLVLLDEPSAGLSPGMAKDLYPLIRELKRPHRAIVLVDQNVTKALEVADVTYELRLGAVTRRVEAGSADGAALVRDWLR